MNIAALLVVLQLASSLLVASQGQNVTQQQKLDAITAAQNAIIAAQNAVNSQPIQVPGTPSPNYPYPVNPVPAYPEPSFEPYEPVLATTEEYTPIMNYSIDFLNELNLSDLAKYEWADIYFVVKVGNSLVVDQKTAFLPTLEDLTIELDNTEFQSIKKLDEEKFNGDPQYQKPFYMVRIKKFDPKLVPTLTFTINGQRIQEEIPVI